MDQPGFLSVPDAARELDVNTSRVRALLAGGQLDGVKLGGRWLVPRSAVWERRNAPRSRGRILIPANAWAVLALASGEKPDWIERNEQRRLVRLLDTRGFERLAPRLRARAESQLFYGHPGILREVADAPELARTGASAARPHGLHLAAGEQVDAYIAANRVRPFVRRMALEPRDENSNVCLRVLPDGLWPFDRRYAPRSVVAIDLAELPDLRAKRIGRAAIQEIDQHHAWRQHAAEPGSRGLGQAASVSRRSARDERGAEGP